MIKNKLILLGCVCILLVGCSSTEEIVADTKDSVHEMFEEGPKGINVKKGNFEFYLPDAMDVQEQQEILENNLLLSEGDQTYILFVNPIEKENRDSRVIYESTQSDNNYILNETFEKNKQFGFVQILALEDKNKTYEVTVGVGGAKLTTITKKTNLVKSAKKMMKIANSVR